MSEDSGELRYLDVEGHGADRAIGLDDKGIEDKVSSLVMEVREQQ